MLNKSLIGVFFVTFIYLLAIFLKQPLEYVFDLQFLPLSLLSLILGMFFLIYSLYLLILLKVENLLRKIYFN